MALYKYTQKVRRSGDRAFDALQVAGAQTPHPGIYMCEGCGREIVSACGFPLPPQNHHEHTPEQGPIRWRMIVYAERPGVN
ncbi:MAG TPA: protein L [Rhodothermia bacterium]|nr:protein L [Rhodothermia bacterium]